MGQGFRALCDVMTRPVKSGDDALDLLTELNRVAIRQLEADEDRLRLNSLRERVQQLEIHNAKLNDRAAELESKLRAAESTIRELRAAQRESVAQ